MRYIHISSQIGLKIRDSIILVAFLINCASAQSVDESLLLKVQKYQTINRQEKIFVQTDRPVYAPGEELWFSAFLFDAPSQRLNQSERVLYLELIDQEGITSQKNIFELEKGRAWGSFILNPKLPPGTYFLLAYTNWMRNSGSDFYFSKQIYIGAEEDVVPIDTSTIQTTVNNDNRLKNEEIISASPSEFHFSFFPEGGNMIEGIQSKVAFEAVNENGQGINLDALVVDETGEIITAAKSLWKGKGFFMLEPQAGKEYFIRIINDANREEQKFKLPEAKTDGLAMAVFDMTKQEQIKVNISRQGNSTATRSATLLCMQNGIPLKAYSIDFSNTQSVEILIDKPEFRSGIVQFTLFDEAKNPLAERLYFVKNSDRLILDMEDVVLPDNPRGKVKLTLNVADHKGKPVEGDFAVSVTDAHRIPDATYNSPDIFQYLSLYADLPDYKNHDGAPFISSVGGNVKSELLMLTNGWRRYSWQEVLSDTISIPEFLEEPGIYVTGTVRKSPKRNRIPEDVEVSMVTGGNGMELFSEKVGEDGAFTFLLKDFEDTLRAVVQTKNRMETKKDFMLNLTTNFHTRSVDSYQNMREAYERTEPTVDLVNQESPKIEKGVLEKQLVRAMSKDTFMITTDYSIEEVTVEAERTKTQKETMTQKYGSPDYSVGKTRISELEKEKPWHYGLMTMISDAFPNLRILTSQSTLKNQRYNGVGSPPQASTISFSNSPSISLQLVGQKMHRFFIYVDGELIAASGTNGLIEEAMGSYSLSDLITLDPELVTSIDLIFPRKYGNRTTLNSDADFFNTDKVVDAENPPDNLQVLIDDSENMSTPSAILSIYTKEGAGLYSPMNYRGISNITLHGFTRVKEFYQPDYSNSDADSILLDYRNTLAWFPGISTDSTGKAEFSFYASDVSSTFRIEVNGTSGNGAVGSLLYKMSEPIFDSDSVYKLAEQKQPDKINYSQGDYRLLLPDSTGAAYALVTCVQKDWCTFTSPEGYFSLDEKCHKDSCRIVFSKSGYQSLAPIDEGNMPEVISLFTSVDTASTLDVKEVLNSFYRNIERNNFRKDYFLEGAYRELLFSESELHQLTDYAFIQRRKKPTSTNSTTDYQVKSGRRFRSDEFRDKINFLPQNRYNGAVPVMDPVFANLSFLNRATRKQYEFILQGETWFEGRRMYHICFDQVEDTPWALYKGELLIDAETFGLAWATWQISDNGKKYLMPDEFLASGGDPGTFKLVNEHNETTWTYNGEYWIPRFAITNVSFYQNGQQNTISREVVWNPNNGMNYRPSPPEELNQRLVFKNAPEYRPEEWRKSWLLPPSKDILSQVKYLINITEYEQ